MNSGIRSRAPSALAEARVKENLVEKFQKLESTGTPIPNAQRTELKEIPIQRLQDKC